MAQLLDPWILNAKDAKGAAKGAKDPKGALGPFGAWWQPPERFRIAKAGNEAFWCPIKKNLCFRWRSCSIPGSLYGRVSGGCREEVLGPFEAWWQPPERFRLGKQANEPFWCPIKEKTFVFDGAMARSLDPQC